ncbi:hypothetical protein L2E14_23735, partial [Salmonella enterica subsp. enterica serovar Weltevreden]|uniref:hypothetical protein n=1 Tax=Salmonella enterica TaxID=28901 RepID=UPI001F27496D
MHNIKKYIIYGLKTKIKKTPNKKEKKNLPKTKKPRKLANKSPRILCADGKNQQSALEKSK